MVISKSPQEHVPCGEEEYNGLKEGLYRYSNVIDEKCMEVSRSRSFPTESALTMNDLCAAGTQNI